jgi:hypothetical protein
VLPLVQREWGLRNSGAGTIFSAYQAGSIPSATLLTSLTDRHRARSIFLISAVWSVVANCWTSGCRRRGDPPRDDWPRIQQEDERAAAEA